MQTEEIRLVELNEELREEYLHLKVYDDQDTFVESPEESLSDQQQHRWATDWTIECIYVGQQMAGYAMHGINPEGDVWLDRFMIDKHYQGRGYGTKALTKLLEKFKTAYPRHRHILLSVEKHNQKVIELYEHFGFRMTGQMDGIYPVMILDHPL